MPKPLTRNQCLENAAFLRALRVTGNVAEAVRRAGVGYGAMQYRRKCFPAFKARWDAALVVAQARLNDQAKRAATRVNRVTSKPGDAGPGRPSAVSPPATLPACGSAALRTAGGEEVLVRLRSGRLQVRRAHGGEVTKQAEQGFLLALASTANITLSAAAVGVSPSVFYKRRARDPGFAREMRRALAEGVETLKGVLVAGFLPDSHADDAWHDNERPALPTVTAAQALQLLALNGRQAQFGFEAIRRRRGPGETREAHNAAIRADYRARMLRAAEEQTCRGLDALAARLSPSPHQTPPPVLPDLDQVRASKARPGSAGLEGRGKGLRRYNAARRRAGRGG